MTKGELLTILAVVPNDATLMSNSGWECDETDMDGVWYNQELNEVHFTQGSKYEIRYQVERYYGGVNGTLRIYPFVRISPPPAGSEEWTP